mgnify:CR=1 FL=1
MKIEIHTKNELIEIEKISYINYSGKQTMVYYDYYYEKKTLLLDGWLSLEQICDKLLDVLENIEIK